jgi:limonene-1,2-epoxide hydrolase
MTSYETVMAFISAMNENNKEKILGCFDDQSVFENVPVGAVKGRKQIWNILASIHDSAKSVKFVLHNVAADEKKGVVLTERTDCYELADRMIKFRAMGTFVVDNGIIREWRDYFDLQQCMAQMPQGTEWPDELR